MLRIQVSPLCSQPPRPSRAGWDLWQPPRWVPEPHGAGNSQGEGNEREGDGKGVAPSKKCGRGKASFGRGLLKGEAQQVWYQASHSTWRSRCLNAHRENNSKLF